MTHEELDALWDFSDPAASEARFSALSEGPLGPAAKTQAARALGLQGKFEESGRLLAEVRPDCKDATAECRWELEAGRRLNSMRRPAEAVSHFEAAWAMAGAEMFYRIDALHMLAIASGSPEERIAWAERGLEAAKSAPDRRAQAWEGSLWNNLGWELFDLGRLEEAKEAFDAQIEARISFGQGDRLLPARWALARCLRQMGRNEEALAIQKELAAQDPTDAYVAEELAILLVDARSKEPAVDGQASPGDE
jgi:tetratricopeptide (TPR) repeat protein